MAGAAPRTEWLEDSFVLDKKGFIVTGPDLAEYSDSQWPLSRSPLLLETSVPGIFAVGDARAGSIKRVASAVGEGAMAVHLVHRYLAESTTLRNGAMEMRHAAMFLRLLAAKAIESSTSFMAIWHWHMEKGPRLPRQRHHYQRFRTSESLKRNHD